jgi:hypothetical protein
MTFKMHREFIRRVSLFPQKLALTSPTNGGRSVSIVRSWTQATEFSFFSLENLLENHSFKLL